MSRKFFLIIVVALLLCLPAFVFAQKATLTGTVTDPNGAIIPDATVTVTDSKKNLLPVRMGTTNEDGRYSFSNLPAGVYQITFTRQGFSRLVQKAVKLDAGRKKIVNVSLQIGNNMTITVGDPALTYNQLITALNTRLPNSVFKDKTSLIEWLIEQIEIRKVDKPLTKDIEELLREAGATDEFIETIKQNSPA